MSGLKLADGQLGRKDGHEVGEGNSMCDLQKLTAFAMEGHTLAQDLEWLKEGMEWELELLQPCRQEEKVEQRCGVGGESQHWALY